MPFRINQKTQLQYKNSLSFTNDFSVAEDGGEPVEPSEEFRYREIIEAIVYFPPFDLQDYPKPFLSYSAELPVELLEAVIEQNGFSVGFNESELYRVYPDKSLQELIDDGDVSVKWFMDSAEVAGETDATLPLDSNNGDEGKSVYAEVTNNIDSSVVTSNTITVEEITEVIYDFEDGISSDWTQTTNFQLYNTPSLGTQCAGNLEGNQIDAILEPSLLSGGKQIEEFEIYWQETSSQAGHTMELLDSNNEQVLVLGGNNPQWNVYDGDGASEIYNGDGYDRWIRYHISFDWATTQYTYTFEDMSSGTIKTGTRKLLKNTDIQKFRLSGDYNNGIYGWGTSALAEWIVVDNILFKF